MREYWFSLRFLPGFAGGKYHFTTVFLFHNEKFSYKIYPRSYGSLIVMSNVFGTVQLFVLLLLNYSPLAEAGVDLVGVDVFLVGLFFSLL